MNEKIKNNNNYFIFNKNENKVKFIKNFDWNLILQPYDSFLSPLYIASSINFNYNKEGEQINIERFLNSLNQTFEVFYFMLSIFKKDENGKISACYKSNDKEFQRDILEIEYKDNILIKDITLENSLPNKIVNYNTDGCVSDLENRSLFFLKLTILKDGFTIGYIFNHGLFDQSCMYYFFKYLSNWYTYGNSNGLKKPLIVNSLEHINENLKFNHLKDAIKFQEDNMGYGNFKTNEIHNKSNENEIEVNSSINNNLSENTVIQLVFNSKDLIQFKGNHIISRNDIITSCLLKILTFTPLLNDNEIFNLKYVCNVRKFLNYDESAIGNFAINKSHKFKIKDIRSMSVLELSLFNRSLISKINENDYKNSLSWFYYMKENEINVLNFLNNLSFFYTTINNWVGFNYDSIQFDNLKPKSLLSPKEYSTFGLNIVVFDHDISDNENYTIYTSVPKNCISKIIEFGISTNLYRVKDS